MANILIVEDEADIRDVVVFNIEAIGHKPLAAQNLAEARQLLKDKRPEAVLLDLMLPDGSGMELCREIKSNPQTRDTHVIIVSAKGEEIDRVVGFELGADDYVVKPFSVRELVLRIQAVMRRRGETDEPESFEFGRLRVDRDAHKVWVDGREIELTALEFKLLVTLHERRNRVQSRQTLLSDVWGIDADITTRTVDTHIKRLREKLCDAGEYVETVRGVGYRFAEAPAMSA